jgi:DNA-binding beta-propeller fold protein YncE
VGFNETNNPILGEKDGLPAGNYKALRIQVSAIDWQAAWNFSNPSPCDGATSGPDSGTLDLSSKSWFYFKTADLGGNSVQHYQINTPTPHNAYAGDADHPLVLPAPITIAKDDTTTVNLVFGTDRTLGCNGVSAFARDTNSKDWTPQQDITGPATGLFGLRLFALDPVRNLIAVASSINNRVVFLDRSNPSGDTTPDVLSGPATILNNPSAVALYHDDTHSDGSGDEYIVANVNNNSLITYAATARDNQKPLRTITGSETGLNQPEGIALNLALGNRKDPGIVALDEIWVANSGNNSITAFARLEYGNALPLYTISGAASGLSSPCGIAIDNGQRLFVTNSGNNSVTVYDITDKNNISLASTLMGSNTTLNQPCGIAVDPVNKEVIVANTVNNTVTTFSDDSSDTQYYAFTPSATPNNVPPKPTRTITTTIKPVGVQLSGDQLWVSQSGPTAEMAALPTVMPVSSITSAANTQLDGNYNVVLYGVDLRQGVNGLGIQIPVIFADRGTINFDPQASPWPSFSLKLGTESKRQIIAAGCPTPDFQTKSGFYGVGANRRFYAFTQDRQGVIDGSFLPDGESFTGTFYAGNELFMIYGIKATGATSPYLTVNGAVNGGATLYAYTSYFNRILSPIPATSDDTFRNELDVGMLYSDPISFIGVTADANRFTIQNPMGDIGVPKSAGPQYVEKIAATQHPYVSHAGGLFENSDYGFAGMISGDSRTMAFMRDITAVGQDNCPLSIGIGLSVSQKPAHTYSIKDIKGTYFVSGFGDNYLKTTATPQYFSTSGTVSFDGAGGVTIALVDNKQGDLSTNDGTFTYKVNVRNISSGAATTSDVIDIYRAADTINPYASAIIGPDGHTLIMYLNLAADKANGYGNNTRLLGFAVLQNP